MVGDEGTELTGEQMNKIQVAAILGAPNPVDTPEGRRLYEGIRSEVQNYPPGTVIEVIDCDL